MSLFDITDVYFVAKKWCQVFPVDESAGHLYSILSVTKHAMFTWQTIDIQIGRETGQETPYINKHVTL